ncbi:acyl-CoA dehydrogenase family protein [Algicola sagamiensis]|uniref:acyl-CoA dehydrogenase family protein n=1 Tax=Algicola sagamiensis TaxID=163869 RepID=UPI000361A1CB|nr:acyl-CoA dehydrogenase family protein [Algicola sagamiensis]
MHLDQAADMTQQKFPQLFQLLSTQSMMDWENSSPETLAGVFRDSRTSAATLPVEFGGLGAKASELTQMIHWVAGRAPSLGLMMVMHHHSLAGLDSFSAYIPEVRQLTSYLASNNMLLASAFAEGYAHQDILKLGISLEKSAGGFVFNGQKKPCTMANVMDAMLLGLNYTNEQGETHIGAAIIPRQTEGVSSCRDFWQADILRNSDTQAVTLNQVFVPDEYMLLSDVMNAQVDDPTKAAMQGKGAAENAVSCWFQVLASAMYLGVAAQMMDKALFEKNGHMIEKSDMLIDYQSTMTALMATAEKLDEGIFNDALRAQCLSVRFSTQKAIERISDRAFEILGGIQFIQNKTLGYLLPACRLLGFHPPSRSAATEEMLAYYGRL